MINTQSLSPHFWSPWVSLTWQPGLSKNLLEPWSLGLDAKYLTITSHEIHWGFPGGAAVKESTCQGKRHKSLTPGLGRSPGVGNGNPLQYSCLEDSMGRGARGGLDLRSHKDSDTTECIQTDRHIRRMLKIPPIQGLVYRCFLKCLPWYHTLYVHTYMIDYIIIVYQVTTCWTQKEGEEKEEK